MQMSFFMFNIPQFLKCRKHFLAVIRFVPLFLFPSFVDIKLVLTLLVAKFIPLPACNKGFFTMLAYTHITVLVRESIRNLIRQRARILNIRRLVWSMRKSTKKKWQIP